ncbi:hypothetical protein L6164_008292 [Bauhinia variegata]|uniref:Uncharacterized protein n=1 Tax=Bauhinia variegata TaxID=167791 RepID=A0ACB9PG68_BAUVA|nr:hypothetical protein L6164_008292 [Bauhinia variegata]
MGKEGYWAGRSSSKKSAAAADTETPSSTGCMCAVFQFFDFHLFIHQQQASFKPNSCNIPQDYNVLKDAEAPRNSLESEKGPMASISKEENFKFPSIRVKTSGSTKARAGTASDLSSEISNSPGAKTPTLVARLMGLDLLPDANSPSSSSCLSPANSQGNPKLHYLRHRQHILTRPRNSTDSDIGSTRSLPETPRISAARRSDVDNHRLSLQINKENVALGEVLELPRLSSYTRRKLEEPSGRSPSQYARQIVKQVKESVSRKAGLDITNTVKSREQAREELVGQLRIKKSSKVSMKVLDECSPGKQSTPSCSPRLSRFADSNKYKPSTTPAPLTPKDQNSQPLKPPPSSAVNVQPQFTRVLTKKKSQTLKEQGLKTQKPVQKCKKIANERFSPGLKKPPQTSDIIRNKKEDSFVRPPSPNRANDIKAKSKKSHPLSSNLLNTAPNLLPVKTDPSPPATKLPQSQSQESDTQESKCNSQLSSCSRQTYKQEVTCILATRDGIKEDKSAGDSTTGADAPEFQYVTGILSRTGVEKGTTVSITERLSSCHPLDPSIFYYLEQNPTSISSSTTMINAQDNIFTLNNQLVLRCNRRLLFDLVDVILMEILRPYKSWMGCDLLFCNEIEGSQLIERVYKKIRSFPCANCQALEDIEALIEEDMPKTKLQGAEALEEEGEGIVAEIENNIWETLVHETVMAYCSPVRTGRRRLATSGTLEL